mgnify:CR=1 FL=1
MTSPKEWKYHAPTGMTLHMRSWGEETGTPLVISHGFLEQSAAWDNVAKSLHRWVITYDQRGHGHSSHVGPDGFYYFFDYVADLDGIAHELGQPIDLAGHSMGGTVACLFTALRPQMVRRLVLIEGIGPPDTTALTINSGQQFLNHRRTPPEHTPLRSIEDGVQRMRKFNHALTEEDAATLVCRNTIQNESGHLVWRWDSRHRSRSPRPFSAELFMHYLKEIYHPTLLIFGGSSFYAGLPDLHDRIACFKNSETVHFKNIGHHPHHECPDQLSLYLRNHCEK